MLDHTDANTGELAPEFRRAIRETLPAGLSPADEAAFWPALAQLNANYATLVERRQQRPAKRELLERWQRIGDLVDELGKELRAVRRDAADPMLTKRTLELLTPLKDASAARVAAYASINTASSKGRGVAVYFLYGGILDLWRSLGQEIRYSKNDGKPVGPLIRFFSACVAPMLGDHMLKPGGIADAIDRERKLRAPRRKAYPGLDARK
jgi:hypothetical protein